jgi:hypothetical protein
MSYAYRYTLPENLTQEQSRKLNQLALETARGASVVRTGKFRRGWKSSISNNVLTVENSVKYAVYLEVGTKYSRQHRFKVRDALNRVGFDTAKPVILIDQPTDSTGLADTQSSNQSTGVGGQVPGGTSNIKGANAPDSLNDLLITSEDPVDILIKPVPKFNDDTRPTIPYRISSVQEEVEAYRKLLGSKEHMISFDEVLTKYKKLIKKPVPIIDLFNKTALTILVSSLLIQSKTEEEQDGRETDIQGEVP